MNELVLSVPAESAMGQESPWHQAIRRFAGNRLALFSLFLLLIVALACYFGPFFFPFTAEDANFDDISLPVNLFSLHPFGSDDLGRDLLIRVLVGGRVSLSIGLLGTLVAVCIGVFYGALAGYFGGWVDPLLMRLVEILYGIPYIFLAIMISVVLGKGTIGLFVAIVVTLWLTPAVIVRGQAVSLRKKEFIEAAQAMGMSRWRQLTDHIMPNCMNVVIAYASLLIPEVILSESFLSFLGLGIQPPDASWGLLIAEGAEHLESDPRLLLLPGAFLALTLFCLNFIADGARDAFDPNER